MLKCVERIKNNNIHKHVLCKEYKVHWYEDVENRSQRVISMKQIYSSLQVLNSCRKQQNTNKRQFGQNEQQTDDFSLFSVLFEIRDQIFCC